MFIKMNRDNRSSIDNVDYKRKSKKLLIKKIFVVILIISVGLFLNGTNSSASQDYRILNSPTSTKEQIEEWAKDVNANKLYKSWIEYGYDIAVEYEVDPTVMFSQIAIETGYGKFGGVIDESYHNTAGIKTKKGGSNHNSNAHMRFNSWEDSLTAQAQHLRLYAGKETPKNKIKDPRYFKEIKGKAKTVNELSQRWATNSTYGNLVNGLCYDIENTPIPKNVHAIDSRRKYSFNESNNELSMVDRIKSIAFKYNGDNDIQSIKDKINNRRNLLVNKDYILNILNK